MLALESVKEQIFTAQLKCKLMSQENKSKRSTNRNLRIQKLRRKVRWLKFYFLDSFLVARSDRSRIRKIKAFLSKIGKTSSADKKYVIACKRRKFRPAKKIHKGPYYAFSRSLPLLTDMVDSTTKPDKLGGQTPLAHTQSGIRQMGTDSHDAKPGKIDVKNQLEENSRTWQTSEPSTPNT